MSKRNIYFGSLEDQLVGIDTDRSENEVTPVVNGSTSSITNHSSNPHPQLPQQNSEFDRRALAKTLQIPTDDLSVRRLLIALNQPITLFGEGPAERRDRLRLMASRAICSLPRAFELFPVLKTLSGSSDNQSAAVSADSEDDEEEFYIPGPVDLIKVRSFLLDDSIHRSQSRKSVLSLDRVTEHSIRTELYAKVKKELDLRETFMDANGRPLSVCAFTPQGDLYTGDWSGRVIKYTSNSGCEVVGNVGDRITAMCTDHSGGILFGTASGKIQINQVRTLSLATTHAIKSLNWHPSNRFFASASADSLWRLWDAVEGVELQVQEGHMDGISSGAWHPDGAIYSTGGTSDGLIRLWDCRMGKSIWTIPGRTNVAISALTFSPLHAHLLASADTDGLVHFHDLRKVQADYLKTAAHRSCCSGLKFLAGGRIIASSGFDGNVRLWCPGDLRLIHDLPVAPTKVTGFDVQPDNLRLAAVTFDRSVKIFST